MMSTRSRIVTAASILMLGNVLSRILGLAREQVIAGLFGATGTTSAFVAAITVPTMVYDLLIQGAIGAALVPVFSDYVHQSARRELGRVAGSVLAWVIVLLIPTVIILEVLSPTIISVLAAGLSADAQEEGLAFVQIAIPSVVFLGISGVTTALLYALQIFVYPAFAAAAYNGGIILLALLLAPLLGPLSLVLGVVFGALAQFLLQIPALRSVPISFSLDFRHPALQRIIRLYTPVAVGLVVSQAGVVIDRNLASQTGEDSIAVMRFATTLVQFPLGLIATATSFAVLPTLSRFGGSNPGAKPSELDSYKQTLALGIRLALMAILPATAGLILLRTPIIRLLFEHGVFDAYGTERTALAFLYYAPQLPFVAVDYLLIFAFYARKDTLTPMLVGLAGVAIYLATALAAMGPMGMAGLALANTVQNSLHAIILFVLLYRTIGTLDGYGLLKTLGKCIIGTAGIVLVYYFLNARLEILLEGPSLQHQILYLTSVILACAATYIAILAILRADELTLWLRAFRLKLAGQSKIERA